MSEHNVDIVIVGAGMVGATLACALRNSDFNVALIDRVAPPQFPGTEYDLRVSAVNVAAQTLFEKTGAWQAMADTRISPMRAMQVWDVTGRGETRFDASDLGEPHLGHIIENNVITRALIDRALEHDAVTGRWSGAVTDMNEADGRVVLKLDAGDEIRARLVVGADGARSQVRELAGIASVIHDYQQRTLVAIARTSESHQQTAWQGFLPTGPLAFLPLAGNLSSIAWHADADFADQLAEMPRNDLETLLEREYDGRLGSVELLTPVGGFNLFRMHARSYHASRTVLIGDAAHAVHPLAGLGANLGFMDAAALAEILLDHPTRDPGDARSLRRYERWRSAQNTAIVGATDAFKNVFGSRNGVVESARNAGLVAANLARPAKRAVMRYAMGIEGDLPQLTRR